MQRWNDDKCWYECKEMIDKGVCDEGYSWNPRNCECEWDKSCDFGEYLDSENCKCRKRLVDKLIEECNKNIDEAKLTEIALAENENSYKCSFCTVYIVLFWICFTVTVGGISAYFIYFHGGLKKMFTRETTIYWTYKMGIVKQIDIKNRTCYFYNDIIDIKNFDARLLKIDKTSYKNIGIYNIGYITIKKIDDCESIHNVNPMYLRVDHVNGYIEKKGVNKYLVFHSTDENKELVKKYNDVFNGIRDKMEEISSDEWDYEKDFMNIAINSAIKQNIKISQYDYICFWRRW